MAQSLQLIVSDDTMRVVVNELIPGCTESMIIDALACEDITTGILNGAIAAAIRRVNDSGMVERNVLVASAESLACSVQCGKNGQIINNEDLDSFLNDLRIIGASITKGDIATPLRNGIFVKANETALTVKITPVKVNVYGNALTAEYKPPFFQKERCIALKTIPEGYALLALASGYLVINDSGAFDIAEPFVASDDKLALFCYMLPLVHGREAFIDKVIRSSPPVSAATTVSPVRDLSTLVTPEHIEKIELRRGQLPIPGRAGSIRFCIPAPDDETPVGDRINHRKGRYREITAGTLLAERLPLVQSVPGINVFGDPIDISKVKDIIFSYGNGVREELSEDCIRYYAKENGILEMSDNYLNVLPELIIHGDVGSTTGNITFSRSVTVNGTITSGFRIECGDLTVRDTVEDSVEVVCSGNLFVSKGIIGERTKVSVAGSAKIGLVQGANVRVQGDCIVEEFAYQATIFCAKKLRINGKGISTREKGCIIGGSVSCLCTMDLHSVGSVATLTTLCCGFDPEGYELLMGTITLEKTLKKKILLLQNQLQFNPSQKETLLQKIQHYSPEKKEMLKQILQELRETISQVEKTGASIALLSRKVFSSDITRSSITIRHHIIAPTLVEFPKLKRKIYRDSYGVRFCIANGDIAAIENLSNLDTASSSPG